jgi:hypothetical protein
MTGLSIQEFEAYEKQLKPQIGEAEEKRLNRADRQRKIGGGAKCELEGRDRLLLTIVWLKRYPTHEVLGYLFGVSDSTAGRYIKRLLPILEASGQAGMKKAGPRGKRGQGLEELLAETPGLTVLIDSFEQRVQRPRLPAEADEYYSGKKKQHTLKTQVAVDEQTGEIIDISTSVKGPTADLTLLKESKLLDELPPETQIMADLGYQGIRSLHPHAATPKKKPRGKPRPPEDIVFNKAFASRRVRVEHGINRLRRYESLSHTDRNHRQDHTARARAVAGLVNHQIRSRRCAVYAH